MRSLLTSLAGAIALATAASPAPAATIGVTITAGGFAPKDVTIQVGDTVTWTNADVSVHQIQATNGSFLSPVLPNGQSFSVTFTSAGRVNYQDVNEKKLKGSVDVVTPVAATVSVTLAKATVLYGETTTLSGTVSTKAAGEPVTVLARAFGESALMQIGSLTTGVGGAWSLAVKPGIGTTYEARWKTATSAQVAVSVRPRVTLTQKPGGYFLTKVAPGMTGKTVFLQRWSVTLKVWITVKKAVLNASSTARIRWRPSKGDYKVRILLTAKQAVPGYLPGASPSRIYVRA